MAGNLPEHVRESYPMRVMFTVLLMALIVRSGSTGTTTFGHFAQMMQSTMPGRSSQENALLLYRRRVQFWIAGWAGEPALAWHLHRSCRNAHAI